MRWQEWGKICRFPIYDSFNRSTLRLILKNRFDYLLYPYNNLVRKGEKKIWKFTFMVSPSMASTLISTIRNLLIVPTNIWSPVIFITFRLSPVIEICSIWRDKNWSPSAGELLKVEHGRSLQLREIGWYLYHICIREMSGVFWFFHDLDRWRWRSWFAS